MKNKDSMFFGISFALAGLAIAFILFSQPDRSSKDWIGFYSPAHCKECGETKLFHSPLFHDLKTCKIWGQTILNGRNDPEDTFMCGYKCAEKDGNYLCRSKVDN